MHRKTMMSVFMISITASIDAGGTGKNRLDESEKMKKVEATYAQEEVRYENRDAGITLAGTLTVPRTQTPPPAVILIAGMGPNDRDCTMLGHKPFLVLADYLTQRGIAVLRFDKRGVGASTGTYDMTVTSADFADDVRAGIAYLKTRSDIDSARIGLVGESEGGVIASMVSASSSDVACVVLLAAAVVNAVDDVVEEIAAQLRADGATAEMIAYDRIVHTRLLTIVTQEPDGVHADNLMRGAIDQYWRDLPEAQKQEASTLPFGVTQANAEETIATFNAPWYRYFLALKPAEILAQISAPVLALNGDRDFIVLSCIAVPIIDKALSAGGNRDYDVRELHGFNHWLQRCQTGALREYGAIEESIAPAVLEMVAEWLVARFTPQP